MQSLLYVFGPAFLYVCLGIAVLYLVTHFTRSMRTKTRQARERIRYANAAELTVCNLLVSIESNPLLRDQLPAQSLDALYRLQDPNDERTVYVPQVHYQARDAERPGPAVRRRGL